MLHLYNEEFFFKGRAKALVKKLLGKDFGGPQAVFASLTQGLKEVGQPFDINQPDSRDTACVLNGAATLRWAIGQKKENKIKKIVAGPNIVITPEDQNSLLSSSEIDAVVVPSEWNKNWFASLKPQIKDKLRVWAAGVEDLGEKRKEDGICLVFKKSVPQDLFSSILETLRQNNLSFEVLTYGSYKKSDYQRLLGQTKFLIYCNELESQGLALHEAWMANVPTLVWNPKVFNYRHYHWSDPKITAPYLEENCGMFFRGQEDFPQKLRDFLGHYGQFDPRAFSLQNFTNAAAAKNYLNLINSL